MCLISMHPCRKFGPDGTDYAQFPKRNVEYFTGARVFTPRNGEFPGARFYTPCLETCPLHPRTTRIEAVVWCGLVWPCAVCCGFAVVWCGHLWFCAVCCGFVGPWSGVVL